MLLGSGCPASHVLLRALLQEALAEADDCRNTETACFACDREGLVPTPVIQQTDVEHTIGVPVVLIR